MFRFLISESAWGWTEIELYDQLVRHLEGRGLEIARGRVDRWEVRHGFLRRRRQWRVEAACAIIVDDRTGRFSVLDCGDRVDDHDAKLKPALKDPRCRVYLKAQYRSSAYARVPFDKVRPWIYIEQTPLFLQHRLNGYRGREKTRRELYFRGKLEHSSREEILAGLRPSGILSPDPRSISVEGYLEELSAHRLALCLPGHGNLCHREIEAFAVGTPVLMPVLKNSLHEPLVPDVHYIAVDVDTEKASPEEVAGKLYRRYDEVIEDRMLLATIRERAMQWYERNARFPASLELTARLLGLPPEASGSVSSEVVAPS